MLKSSFDHSSFDPKFSFNLIFVFFLIKCQIFIGFLELVKEVRGGGKSVALS